MKPLMLFVLVLAIPLLAQAQKNGLILDDEAYEAAVLMDKDSTRGKIPRTINLRKYCPIPGDQQDLPSCVAWALANAMTLQKARADKVSDAQMINERKFSVAYIYNQIKYKGDCDLGASFAAGIKLLKTKGNCPENLLPYSTNCNPTPNQSHHQKAYPNRIAGYRKVFSGGASKDEKIDNILDALAAKRPVLIGMKVPYDFRSRIPPLRSAWKAEDPHAMLIVGYSEITETFLIMNSYGSNWGDNGFFRMDWDTLGEQVRYAYVLSL
jgi:C1A family cysteine protease